VARIRLALEPEGLAHLLHLDTNGKEAQAAAWTGRKRALALLSPLRRERESAEVARGFLAGMDSPPGNGGEPHWR
jgi:hypothetical protein